MDAKRNHKSNKSEWKHLYPDIKKHPVEFYGHFYLDDSLQAQRNRNNEYCPFLDMRCAKRRKSQPNVTIGTCSVGYRAEFQEKYKPIIICPERLRSPQVFGKIEQAILPLKGTFFRTDEVPLVGTSIDHILGKKQGNEIIDFCGVEIQTLDTTGSVWQAVLDFKAGKMKGTYNYGMNWAMTYVKTMLQQAYMKGTLFDKWNKKLVYVIQDVGMEFLRETHDISGFHKKRMEDPVHFHIYSLKYNPKTKKYDLELREEMSSTVEGIGRIMLPSLEKQLPTIDQFKQTLKNRLTKNST